MAAMPEPPKYRAFLSYSHADTRVAARLHSRLEGFRIDKDLAGRDTPMGPVPAALRPIFRDRAEFDAGGSLAAMTREALDDSAALIVLASPNAARSPYVNEETRLFRHLHPDRPVIPLIVAGPPHLTDQDVFPPALCFRLDAAGAISDARDEILAADAREGGDGRALALAKVVARVIGVSPDEVFRRAERIRRRQVRFRAALATVIVALGVAAGVTTWMFWQADQHRVAAERELTDAKALAIRLLGANPARAAAPGEAESLTKAITAIAANADTDARYAKALALVKDGKTTEAAALLEAVAKDSEAAITRDRKHAAEAYRTLGSIAGLADPKKARAAYAAAARLDPDDVDGMLWYGWFSVDAGDLIQAETAYRRVVALGKPGQDDRSLYWAGLGLGDIQAQRGDLNGARSAYDHAAAIADDLVKATPDNVFWQRDLSVSYNKVGEVLELQGKLPEALKSYRDGLAVSDRLAKAEPGNTVWQRDVAVSHENIGDVLVAQGNLPEALKSYRDSLAIVGVLTAADTGNAGWQRDLSVSHNKVGNVLVAQGNLPEALKSYREGLAIIDRLANADPGNAVWQRDLSVSNDMVGNVLEAQGNLPEALKSYRDSLAIRDRLAKTDPGNALWQRDLSVSYNKIGDVLVAQGHLEEALKSFRDSLAIIGRLANTDPGNALW